MLSCLSTILVFGAVIALGPNAQAESNFQKRHPRRAQVLKRDRNLKNKTQAAENSGKITQGQAQHLEKEENAIHNQEQAEAAANGGHITKGEQRQLNREENRVNRQLSRDERKDAAGGGGAPAGGNAPAPAGGTTTPPAGGTTTPPAGGN
jgi:hypothetical protein